MFELKINQTVPYTFSDGRKSTTNEEVTLYFINMEDAVTTMNLAMMGSKEEIKFEIREIEEGQINED